MRDLTPATRGIPATAEGWQSEAHDLRVLQKVAQAERAIYGRITEQTARLIAERVAATETDALIVRVTVQ